MDVKKLLKLSNIDSALKDYLSENWDSLDKKIQKEIIGHLKNNINQNQKTYIDFLKNLKKLKTQFAKKSLKAEIEAEKIIEKHKNAK